MHAPAWPTPLQEHVLQPSNHCRHVAGHTGRAAVVVVVGFGDEGQPNSPGNLAQYASTDTPAAHARQVGVMAVQHTVGFLTLVVVVGWAVVAHWTVVVVGVGVTGGLAYCRHWAGRSVAQYLRVHANALLVLYRASNGLQLQVLHPSK